MSILIQQKNVEHMQMKLNQTQSCHMLPLNQENTECLKKKMKQLQLEIQSLQKLKNQRNLSENKSSTQRIHQSVNNQNFQSEIQVEYGSSSVMSQSLKNTKINDLISQLSFKNFSTTKRKRSWSKTIIPQSQRKSLRNLQETLQKIDISEQNNKKIIATKIFHRKQQSNNVHSNIFNVTIAEIMAGQHQKKEEDKIKMLTEINDLKSKILELTTEKEKKDKEIAQKNQQSSKIDQKIRKNNLVKQIDIQIQKLPKVGKNILISQKEDKSKKIEKEALKLQPSSKVEQNKFIIEKEQKSKEDEQKGQQTPAVEKNTARLRMKAKEFSPYQEQKTQRGTIKINELILFEKQQNTANNVFKRTPERLESNEFNNLTRQNQKTFRKQITGTGKIYNRSKISRPKNSGNQDYGSITTFDFQIQHPQQSIQLKRNTNPFTWNPQITLTLIQSSEDQSNHQVKSGRIYTSHERRKNIQYSEQKGQENKKPLFNIMKKKKITSQSKKEDYIQKIVEKTEEMKSEIKSKQKIDENNDQRIQQQIVQKVVEKPKRQFKKPEERLNQIKINLVKNDPFQPKDLLPDFKQYIDSRLISITLPPAPTFQFGQSQLEQLGKKVFQLFDIFVDEEIEKKGIEYKVTKYKNCVLFRLNEEINIAWYFDGRFYFGGWEINLIGDARKDGFGFQMIPNKYIYQGFFKGSKREGYGIMCQFSKSNLKDTIIYDGFWKEGIKDGKGYQVQAQLQYLGDFKMGLQTGQCKIRTQQTLYEGQIRESVKVGKGHQILKNGDEYFGDFQGNLFQGTGEYRWKGGAYFYGNFANGTRKGAGIWISNIFSEKFDIYKGSYEDNKKNGYGVYQWANGTIYDGNFKNDLRHDEGMMVFPNGKAAKFIWKEGEKTTKLYCEEEQTYRRSKNSTNKISEEKENQVLRNESKLLTSNRSNFSFQVINELEKSNLRLFTFQKRKIQ